MPDHLGISLDSSSMIQTLTRTSACNSSAPMWFSGKLEYLHILQIAMCPDAIQFNFVQIIGIKRPFWEFGLCK